jgi:hypothetical protein
MAWIKTSFFFLYFGLIIITVGCLFLFAGIFWYDILSAFISPVIIGVGLVLVLKFFWESYKETRQLEQLGNEKQ